MGRGDGRQRSRRDWTGTGDLGSGVANSDIVSQGHLPLKLRLKEETNFRLDFLLLGYF